MNKQTKSPEIDMINGGLSGKILLFAIPIMLSGILQLLFNAADVMVVGKWAGRLALAAVGSNSSLINLFTNLFMGLSVGTGVQVATNYGAGNNKAVSETVHTSVLLGLISGVFLTLVGLTFAGSILELMGTPEDVIELSKLYMRIYFLGMPFMLLYNFGSSILRSVGDTRRPLYYLTAAGIINVGLNVLFVVGFQMGVAGVALATIISQGVSCFLIIKRLMTAESCIKLEWLKLKLHPDKLKRIIRIGLPAGMQGLIFSLSNVVIQSSVNSFGSVIMAGNTAAANIEGFVYTSMNAFAQASITFTSQNRGAGKFSRINKILVRCLLIVTAVGFTVASTVLLMGTQVLSLYSTNQEVIAVGLRRLSVILSFYFLCGSMDVVVGSLRGLGYSIMPMIVSTIGACGVRLLWVATAFTWYRSLETLYMAYPISWAITTTVHLICYLIVRRKFPSKDIVKAQSAV